LKSGTVSFDSPPGDFFLIQHNTKGAKNPDGSWSFDRTWSDFSTGFGDASLDAQFYWRGLQTVHEWMKTGNWELMVRLRWADDDSMPSLRGKWGWRLYTGFRIGSEAEGFTYNVVAIKKSANMPDSDAATDYIMSSTYNGMKFSTKDQGPKTSCANNYGGGWWYNNCYNVNLNAGNNHVWNGHYPRETIMAIRQIASGQVTSGLVAAAAAVTAAVNRNLSISIDFYVIGYFLLVF
jgi:hypothetical protein